MQVYAIEANAAENSDYTAKAAESAIVKTAASANLFIDKFKFAETIDTDADNKTISHAVNFDAIGANIYRKVFEDNLTAVYDLGENIDTFEVWMQVYREKTNTPGDTTFEVSVDGVEWTPVTAVRDGSDYTSTENWVTKDWKYSASDVQTTLPGAKYLKVIFGAPCYKSNGTTKILESVRLKQVKVTTTESTAVPTAEPTATATAEPTAAPTAEPTAEAANADYYVYTSDDESTIFDGVKMTDWTKSNISGDTANPMFEKTEVTVTGEETPSYGIARQAGGTANNKAGYVTYKVENISSAKIGFIIGKNSNKVPAMPPVIEASADNSAWTTINGIQEGDLPAENGQFVRMAYTYTDIPAETQYIRINFPMPTTGDTTGYKGVTLENVKFSKDAGIGALAGVTAAAKGTDGLTASWEALTTDKNIEYVVAVDGKQVAKVGKDKTSYDISGLEEQTEL